MGDQDLEDVGGRMTRVLLASTGECIGTAARIQQDGLTVSCRHVFVDDGNFLSAIGWGEKLAFVASSPHDDIVLLQGPPGKHFDMTEKVLQVGRPVLMAGFPAASDQVFPRQPAGQPMITAGTICCYDRDFELAAATYQGAMPNSSGAPVLDDTCSLRGVHVGTCYHLDELHAQNQESMAAPRKIETSVDELWVEELQPAQKPSSSLNTISSDLSAMSLAQHACANIQHKAFIGIFVPHNRLLQILEGLSLFPSDALRHTKQGSTMSKLTNKRPRGN